MVDSAVAPSSDIPSYTVGHVRWCPEGSRAPTVPTLLVTVIAETNRHADHADILRELIDGRVEMRAGHTNLPAGDTAR